MGDDEYRYPLGVTADEEGNSIVRVCVVIPGLEKKLIGDDAKNAIVRFKPERQSLEVMVGMKKTSDKYRYQVKKLPAEIEPAFSSYKVKKDQVVIKLKKAKPESWARELSDNGLETYDSDNEKGDS